MKLYYWYCSKMVADLKHQNSEKLKHSSQTTNILQKFPSQIESLGGMSLGMVQMYVFRGFADRFISAYLLLVA